ncbi:hypothetical protein F3J02_01455 [Acinetobacter sp. Tr-809]|uniref:hypothetical protein n=1 Tax=Acinetobacter sp. Tr-809 TaxID=2608324 RepID=UPI00141F1110|nr:hypothetical protein [Acinetobacter sp. Tr-809]NIE95160.1 hypothetical protein [Acinetobacter sp. Tr-809]
MNAIKFIQQHGVEKAREVVEGAPVTYTGTETASLCYRAKDQKYSTRFKPSNLLVNVSSLKRLVESVDLVGKVGGISQAKTQVKQAHEHGYQTMSIPVEIKGSMGMGCLYIDTLEKAIADYEEIGGGHV